MSLLYTISKYKCRYFSICIPYSLLIFETLKRGQAGIPPSYGKWLVLFVITFVFNGLTIFHSWLLTFVDLLLKIGIYFLPENMNEIIEDRIRNLHLQGIIESYRCKFINKLFDGFNTTTHFLMNQLREEESEQFREALIQGLSQKQEKVKLSIQPKEKLMNNAEVQCIIINDKSIDEAKALFDKKLQLIEKEKESLEKRKMDWEKKSIKKYEAQREFEPKPRKSSNKVQIPNEMVQTLPAGGFRQKNVDKIIEPPAERQLGSSSSIKNLAQSNQFLPEDFQAQEEVNKPVSKLRYSRNTEEKTAEKPVKAKIAPKEEAGGLRRSNTTLDGLKISTSNVASRERSNSPSGSSLREQAQILQKLDLSVSEYSDMFEEEDVEDDQEDSNKLVCKVEAIVQIGSAPNARLEIYNLQLYSNRDLRIISLYNREFEKHKLVSMVKGANNYYQLNLSGTVVTKRRVKFRGQFQPFTKYLQ